MKKSILQFLIQLFFIISFGLFLSNNSYATGTVYRYLDFENPSFPPAGWNLNTPTYWWIRTTYCSAYGNGSACMDADFYDVASGGHLDFYSNSFPATTAGDSLSFDHAYTCETNENDQLVIYYSIDGGSTWNILVTLNGGASGPLVTAPPTLKMFVPTTTQWATKSYALPVGTNAVKFTGISAYGNNLYLDNIRIGTKYNNDVGVNSIFNPKWGFTPTNTAPMGSVRNYGTTTQSFSVTLTINPGSYSNTQTVSNLAPGQVQTVTFANFNFNTNGNYTLKAYTSLASDQNPANDTITNIVVVTPAPRTPLLEFCTGTWCQWCACGDAVADTLSVRYPNSLIMAYHGGGGGDPYQTFNGSNIISLMGWNGYPEGNVNRRGNGTTSGWGSFFSDAECDLYQNPSALVNIQITSQNYNSSTRVLSVNLSATALQTLSGSQYKINYVITEDNLIYTQTGNSTCAGNSNWVHNWVTRNMVNGATGDNVNTGTWTQGQIYNLNFSTTLDNSWVAGNCKANIFVYDATNGTNISAFVAGGTKVPVTTTGIRENGNEIPARYELEQNYPNPFNPTTNIKFAIPQGTDVKFKVYDITGRLVATYVDGNLKAGFYNVEFDGSKLSSGIYFYSLITKDFVQTKKMIILK